MRKSPTRNLSLAAVAIVVLATVAASAAEARSRGGRGGHRGGRRGAVSFRVGGFYPSYGFGYGYGYGYGYHGPYRAYGPEGGLNPALARLHGFGGLDLNVKPKKAEVWVDGRYAGTTADFDGYPSFLWLEEGDHTVAIYKGGYLTWEQEVGVFPGAVSSLKFRLAPGPSEPPARAD